MFDVDGSTERVRDFASHFKVMFFEAAGVCVCVGKSLGNHLGFQVCLGH